MHSRVVMIAAGGCGSQFGVESFHLSNIKLKRGAVVVVQHPSRESCRLLFYFCFEAIDIASCNGNIFPVAR